MKIKNKLLPLLTIGSVGAIITPMITSCAKAVFSTSNLEFKPSSQHTESKYQKTKLELGKEYFANSLYLIEDIVYPRMNSINNQYKELIKDTNNSDVKYQVNFTINSIDIKDVFIKQIETDDGWKYDVPGAYVSLSLTLQLNKSYTRTVPKEALEKGIDKEIDKSVEESTYKSILNNYFVYILYDDVEKAWSVGFYADKENNWYSHWSQVGYKKDTHIVTRGNNEYTYETIDKTDQTAEDSRMLEHDDHREILSDIGARQSYYLKNVIPKIENK